MSARRDPAVDTLLRAAQLRLRRERVGAALRRATAVAVVLLAVAMLGHFLVAPLPAPWPAIAAVLGLAVVACVAYARPLDERTVAEWIDRRLDGASTFATLEEYATDPRPAAALLRAAAGARARACRERLEQLPLAQAPTRALLLFALAVTFGCAVLALTEGRRASGASSATRAGRAPAVESAAPAVPRARASTGATADAAAPSPSTPPATALAPPPAVDSVPDATTPANADPHAIEAGTTVGEAGEDLAPSARGQASRGDKAGRDAGAGLDRGVAAADEDDPAQLAVELRALLQAPNADPDRQRSRADLAGRYREPGIVGHIDGAPAVAAAPALPPRPLERAALAPATAAWVRAYSGAEAR